MTKLGYIAVIVCAVIVIRFVWAFVCCTKGQKAGNKTGKHDKAGKTIEAEGKGEDKEKDKDKETPKK